MLPSAAVPAASDGVEDGLAEGWEAQSLPDGRIYYWNTNTFETQWTAPTPTRPAGAPLLPGMAAAAMASAPPSTPPHATARNGANTPLSRSNSVFHTPSFVAAAAMEDAPRGKNDSAATRVQDVVRGRVKRTKSNAKNETAPGRRLSLQSSRQTSNAGKLGRASSFMTTARSLFQSGERI